MLDTIKMQDLQMFEHRRGIAWQCSFVRDGNIVFHAHNDGLGGMTFVDGVDAMCMVKLRQICNEAVGHEWGLEDIVDCVSGNGKSLDDGLELWNQDKRS